MEVYLVGGAVRDELLGRPVQERDWVVVGATPEDMLALGYRQVGRDFPVFLHPDSGEEYALARTERKTGPGHTGFEVHAAPSVTLEEDLRRRDLTINAMARTAEGALIDPYGGQGDLRERVLRHVSAAFAEDPLRVFRVARFASTLPDFEIAEETRALMAAMAEEGALDELSAERVWAEVVKALAGVQPERFVHVLRGCGALEPWFVEFVGCEPMSVPEQLLEMPQRYAALVSALTAAQVQHLSVRLKAPRAFSRLAGWLVRHRTVWMDWSAADTASLYQALTEARAFKPDSGLASVLAVAAALGARAPARLSAAVVEVVDVVRVEDLQARGLSGAALGEALDQARIAALGRIQANA